MMSEFTGEHEDSSGVEHPAQDVVAVVSESKDVVEADSTHLQAAGEALIDKLLRFGIDGAGPWKGAQATADEALAASSDAEHAIKSLIATHRRLVGVTGFATGFGGLATMAVTLPADVVSFQVSSTRMIAGIAHLRGHDLSSEYTRSLVLVCLLGASGTQVMSEAGIQIGTKAATSALRKLPGHMIVRLNQRVGFRLVTKFGQKGVVNLVKVIPVLGGGIGAGVNVTGISLLAGYAKRNFPAIERSSSS